MREKIELSDGKWPSWKDLSGGYKMNRELKGIIDEIFETGNEPAFEHLLLTWSESGGGEDELARYMAPIAMELGWDIPLHVFYDSREGRIRPLTEIEQGNTGAAGYLQSLFAERDN